MNGIINILKPPGMTSQNVVSYVKRLLKADKAGHTGTLDPGASGVLPVCIGNATRISEFLLNDKKSYRAEMCLGLRSDTLDKYGRIEKVETPVMDIDSINNAFEKFMGTIFQIPPMYSAVKYNGQRLYELARQGVVVDRHEREAFIYDIKILKIDNDNILFDVICSKGTYIRSLISDLGKTLESDAIMTFLLRTGTGPFKIDNAVTLDELNEIIEKGDIGDVLYPIEKGLESFDRVYIDGSLAAKVRNGLGFTLDKKLFYDKRDFCSRILIFDDIKKFIAIGRLEEGNFITVDKVFS